jgi:hypothetical protein
MEAPLPEMSHKVSCIISFDDIPGTVDLDTTLGRFGEHRHHSGAWSDTFPENNLTYNNFLPPVNLCSHVVRDVKLTENNDLEIILEIINSPRGFTLAKQYDTSKFKIVPVMDENLINIYRFDFVKEE